MQEVIQETVSVMIRRCISYGLFDFPKKGILLTEVKNSKYSGFFILFVT